MKKLAFSSKDKTSGTNSNYKINVIYPIKNIQFMYLEHAIIPYSWYTIMTGINDTLTIDDGTEYAVTITSNRNYSASELATELQTQIRSAYTPDNLHTVTFDGDTNKYTIAHSSTAFSINFGDDSSMAKTLGFVSSDTSSATSHTSINLATLIYSQSIYVTSNKIADPNYTTPNHKGNVLFVLPISGSFGDHIVYENQGSHYRIECDNQTISNFDIQIVFDDLATEIPFNGLDNTFILSYNN